MRIGLSSYSINGVIERGELTLEGAIDWAARNGAEVFELVPFAFRFDDPDSGRIDTDKIKSARKAARDAGISLCNYSVSGDLLQEGEAQEKEVERLCREVDIASELGLTRMRHDIGGWGRKPEENTAAHFDALLPRMAEAAERVSAHAKTRGVKTLLENHGMFVNGSDRVERVINTVNSENYGLLLDTGNIICVDEDPLAFVRRLAARADMVHLKDFYVRAGNPGDAAPNYPQGTGFLSRGGIWLRGAILGQGDLDIPGTIRALKQAGYTGDVAIEFEGLEEARYASAVSIQNAKRWLQEAAEA